MKDVIVFAEEAHGLSKSAPKLAPGLHKATVIAVDHKRGEDFAKAAMAVLTATGTVMIENVYDFEQLGQPFKIKQRLHGMHDLFMQKAFILTRSARNRHYQRKAQPNRGPVGRNQW